MRGRECVTPPLFVRECVCLTELQIKCTYYVISSTFVYGTVNCVQYIAFFLSEGGGNTLTLSQGVVHGLKSGFLL